MMRSLLVSMLLVFPLSLNECESDADGDGWTDSDGDCNDASSTTHPGAPELCNSVDDDCDGQFDEDCCADESCGCCKICDTGKACGDSCISESYECWQPSGCACDVEDIPLMPQGEPGEVIRQILECLEQSGGEPMGDWCIGHI